MSFSISKSLVSGVAAVAMSAAVALSSAPADAAFFHGGGFGGFHGGGFGGFRPGGFGGWHGGWGGWHGGYRPGFGYWHPGYWNGGVWYPGFWAATAAAALATGVVVGAAASCWQSRPVYGPAGAFLGYQSVYVC